MRHFPAPARCGTPPPPRPVVLLLVLFLVLSFRAPATEASDPATPRATILRDALAAEARFDPKTALALFLRADATSPHDPAILQKISREYSDLSDDATDPTEKKRLLGVALDYAGRAVALAPSSAVNVLSLAICHGKLAQLGNTREKIEASRLVKKYAEQALALDPDYAYAHHVLGRWHYEVASLGAAKRWIVRLVYGGLPDASTAEAVRQLRRAVQLAPAIPAHQVELGFALLADGQRDAARKIFQHALTLPPREKHDLIARRRARTALAQLPP